MHMFEIIKYAYQRGIPIPEFTSEIASLATDFKWLKWSVKHGCPITDEVALNSLDDMEMAKWVLDKGYKPNDEFMESVAEDGMLELLQILLNKGYTIPETVRTIALEFDKQNIVDWYDINC
jgi:hypothetical protein